MGADNHPTTRVQTDDKSTRAARLAADLRELSELSDVQKSTRHDGIVSFHFADDRRSGFPPSVMRVLAEHGAELSGGCLEGGSFYSGMTGWTASL